MSVTKFPTANFAVPGSALEQWVEPDNLHADDGAYTSAELFANTGNNAEYAWNGFGIVESEITGIVTGVAVTLKGGFEYEGTSYFYDYDGYLYEDGFGVNARLTVTAEQPAPVWSEPRRLPTGGSLYDGVEMAGADYDLWGLALQASTLSGDQFAVRLTTDNNIDSYEYAGESIIATLGHLTVTVFSAVPSPFVEAAGVIAYCAFATLAATVVEPPTADATRVTRAHTATRVTRQ